MGATSPDNIPYVSTGEYASQADFPVADTAQASAVQSLITSLKNSIAALTSNSTGPAAVPVGTIVAYGGTAAPTGWHLCDGTAHGSSALATVLGSANTPDLRDRFVVGAGSTYSRGNTGGSATVTLTGAQSGTSAHSHTVTVNYNTAAHAHTMDHNHAAATTSATQPTITMSFTTGGESGNELSGTSVGYVTTGTGGGAGGTPLTASQPAHTHTVDLATFYGWTGSHDAQHTHTASASASTEAAAAQAHENRPPYYALVYIIKK